jgi:hypothetical protein
LLVTVIVTQYCPAWETARLEVVAAPGLQKYVTGAVVDGVAIRVTEGLPQVK